MPRLRVKGVGAANCVANVGFVRGVAMLKKPSFEEKTRFQKSAPLTGRLAAGAGKDEPHTESEERGKMPRIRRMVRYDTLIIGTGMSLPQFTPYRNEQSFIAPAETCLTPETCR